MVGFSSFRDASARVDTAQGHRGRTGPLCNPIDDPPVTGPPGSPKAWSDHSRTSRVDSMIDGASDALWLWPNSLWHFPQCHERCVDKDERILALSVLRPVLRRRIRGVRWKSNPTFTPTKARTS